MKNRNIILTSIFICISIIIVYLIKIPILPAYNFLEYEFSDTPIIFLTYHIGTLYGLCAAFITSILQGITISAKSGIVGIIMHIVSTSSYIIIFSILCTKINIYWSIISACIFMTLTMCVLNYIITPIIYGFNKEVTINMIIFGIIPFNLIKSMSNSILFLFLNKYLKNKI